jgi:hypothetical protein
MGIIPHLRHNVNLAKGSKTTEFTIKKAAKTRFCRKSHKCVCKPEKLITVCARKGKNPRKSRIFKGRMDKKESASARRTPDKEFLMAGSDQRSPYIFS